MARRGRSREEETIAQPNEVTDKVYPKEVPRDPDGNVMPNGEISLEEAKEIGALQPDAVIQNTINATVADKKLKGKTEVRWGETDALMLFDEVKKTFGAERTMLYITREEPQPSITVAMVKMSSFRDPMHLHEYISQYHAQRKSGEALYKILFKDINASVRAKGDLRLPAALIDEPAPPPPMHGAFGMNPYAMHAAQVAAYGGNPYAAQFGIGQPPQLPPALPPAPPPQAAPAPAPAVPPPSMPMQPIVLQQPPAQPPAQPQSDPMLHAGLSGIYAQVDAMAKNQSMFMERMFSLLERGQQAAPPPPPPPQMPMMMPAASPVAAPQPPPPPPPATAPIPPPAAAAMGAPPQQQILMVQTGEGPRPAVMVHTPQGPQLFFLQATPPAAPQPQAPAQVAAPPPPPPAPVSPLEQFQQQTTAATEMIAGLGQAYQKIQSIVQPRREEEEEPPPGPVLPTAQGDSEMAPFQTMPLGIGQNPMMLAYNQKDGSINWVGTMLANADKAVNFFEGITKTLAAAQQAHEHQQQVVRQVNGHQTQALPPAQSQTQQQQPTAQPKPQQQMPPPHPPPASANSLIPSMDSWRQISNG